MADEYTVVDTDAHYLEDVGDLAQYFDEDDPWRKRLESRPTKMAPGTTPDHYMYGRIKRDEAFPGETKRMTPEEVPSAMEHLGVDKIVMLSHVALGATRIGAQDDRPYVLAKGYLEYMLDQVTDPSEGIYTAIPAPHQDPDDIIELIDRYGDEDGIVGVCLITKGPEPPLGHRRYDEVYELAQRKGLPIIFHAGGSDLDEFYISGYERFVETHSLGMLWANMAQVTSVVMQAVPERFPDLDFVFQEAGILWVSAYMGRLDAEYMKRRVEAPLLQKRPSEYVKDIYHAIQPLDYPYHMKYFEYAIEAMGGADRLMYASDYPHWDYDPPNAVTDLPFLSTEEKAKVLGTNAEEVFDI